MAQIAKTGAEKAPTIAKDAPGNVAELRQRAAEQGADVVHEAADRAEDAAHRGARTLQRMASTVGEAQRGEARQVAEGTTGFSRVLIDLANEQTRHNFATLKAFTGAVDWGQVIQIQGEYLRASLERTARLTQGYLELGQAVMTSADSAARRQAR